MRKEAIKHKHLPLCWLGSCVAVWLSGSCSPDGPVTAGLSPLSLLPYCPHGSTCRVPVGNPLSDTPSSPALAPGLSRGSSVGRGHLGPADSWPLRETQARPAQRGNSTASSQSVPCRARQVGGQQDHHPLTPPTHCHLSAKSGKGTGIPDSMDGKRQRQAAVHVLPHTPRQTQTGRRGTPGGEEATWQDGLRLRGSGKPGASPI